MEKTAFVFPAQGAQYVGMGKELYDHYEHIRSTYDQANEIMEIDIKQISFTGPKEDLQKTENTQPCIHAMEIGIARQIESFGVVPDMTAGFSLGQYASLVTAGAFRFEDTLQILRKRGIIVDSHVPRDIGKMMAIIGLEDDDIMDIIKEASKVGTLEISDYNCPQEIIVAGLNAAVEYADRLAKEKGARKTVVLPINQPFHTSILDESAAELKKEIMKIDISMPRIPVIENVYAKVIEAPNEIPGLMELHTSRSVRWRQCVEKMIELGARVFLELGPSGLVTKFVNRTADALGIQVETFHIEDCESMEHFRKYIKESLA
ncbi:MAG: ACP S-malonyltransferase [Spirochaetales bacterium]|nr:ACP S-malonyltransferase [Spirochaetales bacterium]